QVTRVTEVNAGNEIRPPSAVTRGDCINDPGVYRILDSLIHRRVHSIHSKAHVGHRLLSGVRQMITCNPVDTGDDLRRAAAFRTVQDPNGMESGEPGHSVSCSCSYRRYERAVPHAIIGVAAGVDGIKAIAYSAFELDMRAGLAEDPAKDPTIDNVNMHARSAVRGKAGGVVQLRATLIDTIQGP